MTFSLEHRKNTLWSRTLAWSPLVILPVFLGIITTESASWVMMWSLALGIYIGLKWLSWFDENNVRLSSARRSIGYLFFWPGMNSRRFFNSEPFPTTPQVDEWISGFVKLVIGAGLIVLALHYVDSHTFLAGWIAGTGLMFVLHFGTLYLLSLFWRSVGIDAPAIMQAPLLSTSLSEFWGKRWNLAFRDMAFCYVFKPLVKRLRPAWASMSVFLVSGLIHDVVISITAKSGYGLPTLYFLLQGICLQFERSRWGEKLGIRKGMRGRLFCLLVTLGPVGLLFHRPFIERVIVPMLVSIKEIL
jgi:hypothetical protein